MNEISVNLWIIGFGLVGIGLYVLFIFVAAKVDNFLR